jgi:hypothetical protein
MAYYNKTKNGPQSRAPLKWGEGAKNLTACQHPGCPNDIMPKVIPWAPGALKSTWNVRTMCKGKLENVKREIKRAEINILGLSQVRWKGQGDFMSDEYRIIYSGGEKGQRGGCGDDIGQDNG